jgi:beta-glucosidase-like glycosyl hydrolase
VSGDRLALERCVGAVLVPEVRVGGTIVGPDPVAPDAAYLRRFPPAGVIAFGRTPQGAKSPAPLLSRLRAACAEPPFAACDLEQGAGLHFPDATRLPPALAIAAAELGDPRARLAHRAGALTGREARARGVELVLAPVCDVNTRRDNPIIAVRSFNADPQRSALLVATWLDGLHAGGAGGCAKHFPGHGDTREDSHLELARVERDADGFRAIDFVPFAAAIARGVESVMVAHVDAPPITGEPGLPATLSRRAIVEVLRGELGFGGAVLSDAMNMGALAAFGARHARALAAGCDGLLCPADPLAAAEEILAAVERGELARERLEDAARRMGELRAALFARAPSTDADESLAPRLAAAALVRSTARWPWKPGAPVEVLAPFPDGGADVGPEARAAIHDLRRELVAPTGAAAALVPVVAEVRAFGGRYGLTPEELAQLDRKLDDLEGLGWKVALAWFASPQSLPESWWRRRAILLAFAPTPPMVRAVADFLAGRARAGGSLPVRLG